MRRCVDHDPGLEIDGADLDRAEALRPVPENPWAATGPMHEQNRGSWLFEAHSPNPRIGSGKSSAKVQLLLQYATMSELYEPKSSSNRRLRSRSPSLMQTPMSSMTGIVRSGGAFV
jgi:hypothetical protein